MRVDAFQYELDPARIAQHPTADREAARLMVLGPHAADGPSHATIGALADHVPEGSVVVVNDTRVLPARLLGTKRGTGGQAEIFLVRRVEPSPDPAFSSVWTAIGRASKGLREGTVIEIGALSAHVLRSREGRGDLLTVGLATRDGTSVEAAIRRYGLVPLPPYIRREGQRAGEAGPQGEDDAARYQTVYARVDGAVAAPTAGLHLTEPLLARLRERGCTIAAVTLHVGLGTFQPVTAEDLDQHAMHEEWFCVPEQTASAIARARAAGRPVVAVGTTVVRALESACAPATATATARDGVPAVTEGETKLLIQPGYRFRVVDILLTNLHLPGSTLLALVCAFGGIERVLSAYRTATREGYRFFSYGDAMLLWPSPEAR